VSAPSATPGQGGPPLSKEERKAQIRATLKAAGASDSAAARGATAAPVDIVPDGKNDTPHGTSGAQNIPPGKIDAPAEARSVAVISRLSADKRALESRVKELEAKSADQTDSVAALRAKVKADPGVLLDVFGADIAEDETKRLEAFNDAVIRRADPTRVAQTAQDREIADLRARLDAKEKADQERASQASDERGRGNVQRAMVEGFRDGDVQVIPAGAYPYCEHLTKIGQEDAFGGVMLAAREMAVAFQESEGREPTRKEVGEFIKIAADTAEQHFRDRTIAAQLPVKTDTVTQAKDPTPRTITPDMSAGGTVARPSRTLSKEERHAEITAKLRKETAQAAS
jgi:hypothetical protein